MDFTFEEMNLMCIYNSTGTRQGLITALREMTGFLETDETELRDLTASALSKLETLSDTDFDALELVPDFDTDE